MSVFLWIMVFVLLVTIVFGFGFMLWIIAEVLSKFFNVFGFCYTLVSSFVSLKWNTGRKKINDYFYDLGLSKDQHANVVLRDFFNKIMLKTYSIPFGDPDETLSYYFAVNKLIGDRATIDCGLTAFGLFWARLLNLFERSKGGHLHVAIYKKMMKEDAVLRKHGFITNPNVETYKNDIVELFENQL